MISIDNIYLINKPAGWTSFDCVAKLRNKIKKETNSKIKVGHTGTLDPFATGLLILLTGNETKKQASYMKLNKEYHATLFLGAESTTGDPEGKITVTGNKSISITKVLVEQAIKKFIGETEQTPPQYSAIKVHGKPAYKSARSGEAVTLKPRLVTIQKIEILDYTWPKLELQIACSSGTYIRSLAYDLGRELGCGAYLTSLIRTKIGIFTLDKAKELDELVSEG